MNGAGSPGIHSLVLHQAELELDPPQTNANGSWARRSITRLELCDASGARGWGEASPLPGYSPDGSDACAHALQALDAHTLHDLAAIESPRALLDAAAATVASHLPAARFALETALLDRLGLATGRPLFDLLREAMGNPAEAAPVPLCALLPSAEPSRVLDVARAAVARGVRSFKLKIGPDRLVEAQDQTLQVLRAELGPGVALRLDANRSLSLEALERTLARAAELGVEFLEEPIAAFDPALLAGSPCPLALDESLQALSNVELERWLASGTVCALVLKPTALGGYSRCLELARAARRHARQVVVSHTFEGPIGWAACAHLALALSGALAAGLWPLGHQQARSPVIIGHQIKVPEEPGLGAGAR